MKKKGFVFIESIVILVATMLSLTILLMGYSVITRKSKIKEEYDRTSDKYLLYNISVLGTTDTKNYNSNEKNFKAEKGMCEDLYDPSDIDGTVYINEVIKNCDSIFKDSNLLYIYTVRDVESSLSGGSTTVLVDKKTKEIKEINEPTQIYDNGTIEYMKTLKKCNTYAMDSDGNKDICIEPIHYMIGVFEKDNTNYFASIELESAPVEETVNFIVEHYKQNSSGNFTNVTPQSEIRQGIPEAVIVLDKYKTKKEDFIGYYYSFGKESGKETKYASVSPKGDTVIKLYYNRNTYKVKYLPNGGSGTMQDSEHVYDTASPLSSNNYSRLGYAFNGWAYGSQNFTDAQTVKNLTTQNGATVELLAQWKAKTNIPYTINHWTQNLGAPSTQNSTNYTLYKTENKIGTTDTNINASVLSIPGFTSPSIKSVTVKGDGSAEVNYYYTRNTYTINMNHIVYGGTPYAETAFTKTTHQVQYGAQLTLSNSHSVTPPSGTTATHFGSLSYTTEWKKYNVGDILTQPDTNTSINCYYKPIDYIITYNLNGGTNNASNPATYDILTGLTFNNPTKEGYAFLNWTNASGNTITGINPSKTSNILGENMYTELASRTKGNQTINANYTANTYSVKFVGNGSTSGTMEDQTGFVYDIAKSLSANTYKRAFVVTYNYNDNTTANTTVTANAIFSGWATTSTGNVVYADKASVSNLTKTSGATVTLYAKWNDDSITLPTPSRNGYTFSGWYDAATGGTKIGAGGETYKPTSNKTLYARWTGKTYTYNIVYKSSSGKQLGTNTISKTYGTTNSISAKTFTGYTTPGAQSIKWDTTSAKTITFTYTPTTYTISYNLNGGSASNKTTYTIETADFSLVAPTKSNATFSGWTGTGLSTATKTVTIKQGSTGNRSYTAKWLTKYTVSLESTFSADARKSAPTYYKAISSSYYGKIVKAKVTSFQAKGAHTQRTSYNDGDVQFKVYVGSQSLKEGWPYTTPGSWASIGTTGEVAISASSTEGTSTATKNFAISVYNNASALGVFNGSAKATIEYWVEA